MSVVKLERKVISNKTVVSVPASKSLTNRSLILACLSDVESTIENYLLSEDTTAMINALTKLGFVIEKDQSKLKVVNSIRDLTEVNVTLDVNQSGTSLRFLTALCCLIPGEQAITGDPTLMNRPIKPLIQALQSIGADIEQTETSVLVKSESLESGSLELDTSVSSQFLTALLLIAPAIGLEVRFTEKTSWAYVELTLDLLKAYSVEFEESNQSIKIPLKQIQQTTYTVETDISAACYFWALATLSGTEITVDDVSINTKQGDINLLEILEKFGAEVTRNSKSISVKGRELKPVEVDMGSCPDQVMTAAVIAAFADGDTIISGVKTLRHKETDRIEAIKTELEKMGIQVDVTDEKIVIHGGSPKPARISTYKDHRIAMSFALTAVRLSGMEIENPEVVNKTFPGFWGKLSECGVQTK